MRAHDLPEIAVRYRGGLRMLKRKPSKTNSEGSASVLLEQTETECVCTDARAARSMEMTTLVTGTWGVGNEPPEQFGPRQGR